MERMSLWAHLEALPGHNTWIVVSTFVIGFVVLWAATGACVTSWQRYPPQRPWRSTRSRNDRIRGRRAWAFVAFLMTCVAWSFYRVDALWWSTRAVNDLGVAVEIGRGIAALLLSLAWWPGVNLDPEPDGG